MSEHSQSNPWWSEADPDEDMFGPDESGAGDSSFDITGGSFGDRMSRGLSSLPATPTHPGRRARRRNAEAAQLTPHAPRAGPSSAGPASQSVASPAAIAQASPAPPTGLLASSTPVTQQDPIPAPNYARTGDLLDILKRTQDI